MNVAGSVALVTGGASGLGAGVAKGLVGAGGRVLIADLGSSAGEQAATDLGSAAAFVPVDVTRPDEVAFAVDAASAVWGRIDVLVSCAGISTGQRMLRRSGEMHTLEHFRAHIEVNLIGLFDVLRHTVKHMATNEPDADGERGVIVNIGSIAGIEGQVGQMSYSASKGGIIGMTLPLARDLGSLGIRVVTICPGLMDTPILAPLSDSQIAALTAGAVFPKRSGRPAEVADLVRHIVENTYLNGEVIRLDAGMRLNIS
ncbi:MAG: SDR family NAD(P)-dependent oxidoreductase [bacterium]|nr:SDR family NAD(P)-dependent oxidoreductase [bacterium]